MASSVAPLTVGRIFSLFWNVLYFLYCFVLPLYLFSLPFYANIFGWSPQTFYSSSCRDFSVSSEYVFMLCFSILACCRSPFICDSSLSSHPGSEFLSLVLKETPIFSHTNFTAAYMKSFNSVMSFVSTNYYYIYSFRIFHISVSWWSFPGFWVTASLHKSPGIFSVS